MHLPSAMGRVWRGILARAVEQTNGTCVGSHEAHRVAGTPKRTGLDGGGVVAEDSGLRAALNGAAVEQRARARAIRQDSNLAPALKLALVQLHTRLEAHPEPECCHWEVPEHRVRRHNTGIHHLQREIVQSDI